MKTAPTKVVFRPFMNTPEQQHQSRWMQYLRHPLFACFGLRPIFAQHTRLEHDALRRWAIGRLNLVEIGVAEGGSALALAESMAASATLTLVDPFHLSRWKAVNATRRVAESAVSRAAKGRVVWVRKMSCEAVAEQRYPIDFLLIDGNHEPTAVLRDWTDWHPLVPTGGVVAFHDARVFPEGWPGPSDGPVQVVDELFRTKTNALAWKIVEEVHSLVLVQRIQ
jgi:predicted O-methyltransferase YrrM